MQDLSELQAMADTLAGHLEALPEDIRKAKKIVVDLERQQAKMFDLHRAMLAMLAHPETLPDITPRATVSLPSFAISGSATVTVGGGTKHQQPTLLDQVVARVGRQPGIARRELVEAMLNVIHTASADPKKIVQTRLSQMVRRHQIAEHRGGLYLPHDVPQDPQPDALGL